MSLNIVWYLTKAEIIFKYQGRRLYPPLNPKVGGDHLTSCDPLTLFPPQNRKWSKN